MKGDFSRQTFVPRQHYVAVLEQQGRAITDADRNEGWHILRHRDTTEAKDVIGPCGAPKYEAGFHVEPAPGGGDLLIYPGRFYVHGRLCELEGTPVSASIQSPTQVRVAEWWVDGLEFAPQQYVELSAPNVSPQVVRIQQVDKAQSLLTFTSSISTALQTAVGLRLRHLGTYLTQPDYPDPDYSSQPGPSQPPVLNLPNGTYLLYLDVWERLVTALDDPSIREMALGGPDTCARLKTVWQLWIWPGPGAPPLGAGTTCATPVEGWEAFIAPSTGRMKARTAPVPPTDSPCILPPAAGYIGLENQHYLFEIHDGGELGLDPISVKWSRESGSVVKAIQQIPNTTDFTVYDTGPDDVLGLTNGQWVEQLDDEIELKGIARDLFQFQINPNTQAVTLPHPVDLTRHPKMRRWDSQGEVTIPPSGTWIDAEYRIQIQFSPGTYKTGDYWLVPARTALGDIEWPTDLSGEPLALPRHGTSHAYCRLAVLTVNGATWQVEDCRSVFPPLSELKSAPSCCTFTVADGTKKVGDHTSIQEALDHLPPQGGQICVLEGTYTENVRIKGKQHVHITGCGRRTRVVSPSPTAGGVADPVIHIAESQEIRIEGLEVAAHASGIGILVEGQELGAMTDREADATRPSYATTDISLERLDVSAALDSAIKVLGAQGITIQGCRIEMTDDQGTWPGIFLLGEDGLIKDNVVEGSLRKKGSREVIRMRGAAAASAIQLAGGCERIRVHDNLLKFCTGQGITLGSVEPIGEDGELVQPRGRIAWIVDTRDPCFNCDEMSTGDRTPEDDGEGDPPTRYRSTGSLYEIDIRRNHIEDVGLDGIGVVRFFDIRRRRRAEGLTRVEGLTIVDNRIQRYLRRPVSAISQEMMDLMGYGGVALSYVESLVIRDNVIDDRGALVLNPACGIFVFFGEGIEISRNHILRSFADRVKSDVALKIGRQGGIQIVYSRGPSLNISQAAESSEGEGDRLAFVRARISGAAVVVEENTVHVPLGQALALAAVGPVSVAANRLRSQGLVSLDLRTLLTSSRLGNVLNVLTHLASLVSIVDLGTSTLATHGAANMGMAARFTAGSPTDATHLSASRVGQTNGNILFADNQCVLDLSDGRFGEGPPLPGGFLWPSIVILGSDDLGFEDNQCDAYLREKTIPSGAVLFSMLSLRVIGNRFKETLGKAHYSAFTAGLLNMTVNNQANHCLEALNILQTTDAPNHVLLSAFLKDYCQEAKQVVIRTLTAMRG